MSKRYLYIWFRYLVTDWMCVNDPCLKTKAVIVCAPVHGRMVIRSVNELAEKEGIEPGMVLADARAIVPSIEVKDEQQHLSEKLLKRIAEWCIRFSPVVAIDTPDGIIIEATGCAHLWGGDGNYAEEIKSRISSKGYRVRVSMADTIGCAWALARYGKTNLLASPGNVSNVLLNLPAASLRLDSAVLERLNKLGLQRVRDFINIPKNVLRRRFGGGLIQRIAQATGSEEEYIQPVIPPEIYQERLPSLEPITTATGIEIGLKQLLDALCKRLKSEEKGLRKASFKCYRTDGIIHALQIGTNKASHNALHLFRLFEQKIETLAPGPGIELFVLEANQVEEVDPVQERLWEHLLGLNNQHLSELLDRISGRVGSEQIKRFIPDEHYWPERSYKASSLMEEKELPMWIAERPRPVHLLKVPERIEVTAPIPDYPPMLFRYKGQLHRIKKADGPERIEQEWWIQEGEHRDYYCVEDEMGKRYWLFRSGHYKSNSVFQWYLHGFFA